MTAVDNRSQTVMGRVLLLLEPFRECETLTLTELAERAGFPRSSAHRLLSQLVEVGWLGRNGTAYHLGPKLVELGSEARRHDRIYRAAAPTMYQLRKRTGMTVQLTVLDGDELLFLELIGGRWAASALCARVGQRLPARGTVEGAALLALRDGCGPVVRDSVIRGRAGEWVRCVALAFDAGWQEAAALSLAGPAGRTPEGAVHDLAVAADMVVSQLSA
ncbi:IclR family transcriptional regulator [Nocardia sienata]|uniref:IclR family transcriptional regulator n=1 Tax=Nocardia sienata TaxID=248552 RepID=UPI000A749D33|nr:helix-turn-helix domain-containing protein [Nocardia sienata]